MQQPDIGAQMAAASEQEVAAALAALRLGASPSQALSALGSNAGEAAVRFGLHSNTATLRVAVTQLTVLSGGSGSGSSTHCAMWKRGDAALPWMSTSLASPAILRLEIPCLWRSSAVPPC